MEKNDLVEKIIELQKKSGNIKGETVNYILQYLQKKEGDEAVNKLKERLKELDPSIDITKVKDFSLVKDSFIAIIMLVIKDVFSWTDDDIFNMGKDEPKNSFIVRLLMKYLVSVEKTFERAPDFWRKFYDFGYLEAVEFNQNERYFILKVCEYDTDPVMCKYLAGFIHTMVSFSMKEENVLIEETKCIYNGDDCHEYTVRWK